MPVNLNNSYTTLINPEGASPVLTVPQIWAGLQRKIRYAQEFVPVISGCEVLEEKDDGTVVRDVVFQSGKGPGGKDKLREWVRCWEYSWVDFESEDGTHVRNVVSDGPDGTPATLHMTYMFEYRYPDLQPGTQETEERHATNKMMAKMAVEKTIENIREMVRDGRIKS